MKIKPLKLLNKQGNIIEVYPTLIKNIKIDNNTIEIDGFEYKKEDFYWASWDYFNRILKTLFDNE